MSGLAQAAAIRREVAELVRPRSRMRVSEAAARHVKLSLPGGYAGAFDPRVTPYMIEPMDLLVSRQYSAIVFVGPAQAGKTQALVDAWAAYMVKCDPGDMLIVQTSQITARDFSKRRIDRMHRNSEDLRAELSPARSNDNIFDKLYRNGVFLSIGWPSISQLSGRALKFVALTDYDRMPLDVDGEGAPFALAHKRTTTFLSAGMTLAESSPGWDVQEPKWTPSDPHEAPPAKGIMSLFNLGDRRRFYWPCQSCGAYFMQPSGIDGFAWPQRYDLLGDHLDSVADEAGVPCPHCGVINGPECKPAMVAAHKWVPQGCRIEGGELVGKPRQSDIASFWLPGAAAAFQSWASIVRKYLAAKLDYESTSSEMALKSTTNLDLGEPYIPIGLGDGLDAALLEQRVEDVEKRRVPPEVRFLVAGVDVQANRFVVQVRGYGPGLESWLIDRYNLHWSARESKGQKLPIDPASRIEDWTVLIESVIERGYRLAADPGKRMRVMMTACDSGGRAGVTGRAYEFWRILANRGLARKFMLVKGAAGDRQAARVRRTFPDSTTRRDRKANARGQIPLHILNTTLLKDQIDKDLKRTDPGPGFVHFPDWLGRWFFDELSREVRTPKGWLMTGRKGGNEALDLLCYDRAAVIVLDAERINWQAPPQWARPQDTNLMAVDADRPEPKPPEDPETGKPKPIRELWGRKK